MPPHYPIPKSSKWQYVKNSIHDKPYIVSQQRQPITKVIFLILHTSNLSVLNILIGDMSFVGPRPKFVEKLNKAIPRYDMRHLVKPGFTGWVQINYEYGNLVEDARIKLQYDIYYTKNAR